MCQEETTTPGLYWRQRIEQCNTTRGRSGDTLKDHHIVNKGLLPYSSLLHGKPQRPDLCPKQIVLYSIEILVWSSQTIGQQLLEFFFSYLLGLL